ncbi:hypothetical protein P152DRAFT_454831 [Eremomyces bilateralis CBS 781.70]|uniref:Uncharacterized protein n=1 Tax=Eremomyces bilateralis CBS 781.70 TaxID=1392243 RepID=A0A6G1GF15_9PEZI|nr:uncharacterized protein P152DRAFT_454831 [Eremomyces bilateralis CBS 781.70]KAF1816592.1 hypothetical protein P152DRAFT_454831 [Eremomyces bilateralis CBS 781.70]
MEHSIEMLPHEKASMQGRTLQVDFSWKDFTAKVVGKDDPEAKPVYLVDFKSLKPHLVFKRAEDESTFGTGSLHTFGIDADCELNNQSITLKAQKRFKVEYTHQSRTYSDTDEPVTMHWTRDSDFRVWDFICMDADQSPVAKYSVNCWAFKKIGTIEFMGPKANSDAVKQEILVMGLTLYYCVARRSTSILSFFGALFSQPSHKSKTE